MRVMVVDGGARGQALGMKLAPECDEVFISPGSPGNKDFAVSTGIVPMDIAGQLELAQRNRIDVTIVGAEDPLAAGIVDAFHAEKLAIFGPTAAQARIESDRDFAKELGWRHGMPMGSWHSFSSSRGNEALQYAQRRGLWPLFVKDNSLAQGKGATKCETLEELEAAMGCLSGTVILEDFVGGPEASHHAFCDGKSYLSISCLVRDHKQLGDGDTGPMTGGMGVVGPLPNYSSLDVEKLGDIFVGPVVRELGYKGVLFSGLKGGKLLEWNARLGDAETQVFLSLMQSELLPILRACVEGSLDKIRSPVWRLGQSAVCLVLAAEGYPDKPQKGAVIEGIEAAERINDVHILHAATKKVGNHLVTNGGRVLNIVSQANSLQTALNQVYAAAEHITFNGRPPTFRRDIGHTAVSGH